MGFAWFFGVGIRIEDGRSYIGTPTHVAAGEGASMRQLYARLANYPLIDEMPPSMAI